MPFSTRASQPLAGRFTRLWALLWLVVLNLPLVGTATAKGVGPSSPPTLTQALNPDGTLRAGYQGSFSGQRYRLKTLPDGRPVFRPADVTGTGDDKWLGGFGLPDGTDGMVWDALWVGTDLYIVGDFTMVGGVLANHVAKWNGSSWSSLGSATTSGLVGNAYALALAPNGNVYMGGSFYLTSNTQIQNIARWDGTAWRAMGGVSVNGVSDMAVAPNGDLFVGGSFDQASGLAGNYVAKWNGSTWSALGTGLNSTPGALAVAPNGDLYAGGAFTQAGGMAVANVARWNGSSWSPLGAGVNSRVTALAVAPNGELYAGGNFTQAGGAPASRVAKWNGSAWTALGSSTANGVNGPVQSLAVAPNADLYVGGSFSLAGGTVVASRIARWNGSSWSALGTGITGSFVQTLAVASNGTLCVGGRFSAVGGLPVNNLGLWTGSSWNVVGSGVGNGIPDGVYAVAVAGNGDVYVAGDFERAGLTAVSYVAKWNGTSWSALGTGIGGQVFALAVAPNGDLYAGGNIYQVGTTPALRVARWNGATWSPLGGGLNGTVRALAAGPGGEVYAGGSFAQTGGTGAITVNNVAKWNGTAWSALGAGVGPANAAEVRALAVAGNGDLYAGGGFTTAGSSSANNVARWDGSSWSTLGSGTNSSVLALTIMGTDLYAGGYFTQAGGVAASNIARWSGGTWTSVGSGVDGYVSSLAVSSAGDLYVGGHFTQAGGSTANHVAKWSGSSWSSLGTGLNNDVETLAAGPAGKLYAVGRFTAVGDGSKVMAHFGIYDPAFISATTSAAAPAALCLYPNPARNTATLTLAPAPVARPVQVLDALGRLVRKAQLPAYAGSLLLNVAGLPAGTYTMRCGQASTRLVVE